MSLAQYQALAKKLESKAGGAMESVGLGEADSWDVPSLTEFRAVDQMLRRSAKREAVLRWAEAATVT